MSEAAKSAMTLMGDEEGERMFILVDDMAPTVESVEADWRAAAREQWGIEYGAFDDPDGPDIGRSWYKPMPSGDGLTQCTSDDPERDSEWWSFELPLEVMA